MLTKSQELAPQVVASEDEWQRDISELGAQQKGKRLDWRWIGLSAGGVEGLGGLQGTSGARALSGEGSRKRPSGDLVWFHDGTQEYVAYLPAEGEGSQQAVETIRGLIRGEAVMWGFHGDPSLIQRIDQVAMATSIPAGVDYSAPSFSCSCVVWHS